MTFQRQRGGAAIPRLNAGKLLKEEQKWLN